MPVGTDKKEVHDIVVVRGWKKSIKNWYRTLEEVSIKILNCLYKLVDADLKKVLIVPRREFFPF
jgi:hypothetical protein